MIKSLVLPVTQAAVPVFTTDNIDVVSITGLAQAITSMTTNQSGTPQPGDRVRVEITDNGTAQAIAWGAKFEGYASLQLPPTTMASTKLVCDFVWNATTSAWRLSGVSGWSVTALIRQHAARTLTSSTAVQQLFDIAGAGAGALALPVGTYRFRGLYQLTGMSATSGNSAFSLAGTATLANILQYTVGVDSGSPPQNQGGGLVTTAAFPASQHPATVSTVQQSLIEGTFEVTAAGTIIPSVQLVTASAASVTAGSFFECWLVGATTAVTVGAWS